MLATLELTPEDTSRLASALIAERRRLKDEIHNAGKGTDIYSRHLRLQLEREAAELKRLTHDVASLLTQFANQNYARQLRKQEGMFGP